jgi:hypothetical protein
VSSHRVAELAGVDWELPSTFGLTRRRIKPWRCFRDARNSSGMLVSVKPKLAEVRVCRDLQELERERKEDDV